jgi:hypothetical protein
MESHAEQSFTHDSHGGILPESPVDFAELCAHLLHHARVSEHARHDRLTRRDSFGRILVVSSFNFVTSQSVSLTKTHNLNVSKYLSQPLTIEPAQQNHGPRSVIVAQGARMRLTFYLTGEFETS